MLKYSTDIVESIKYHRSGIPTGVQYAEKGTSIENM